MNIKKLKKIKEDLLSIKALMKGDNEAIEYAIFKVNNDIKIYYHSHDFIIDAVLSAVPRDFTICSADEDREIKFYRYIAYWALRKYTKASERYIGEILCNKDHATVYYAINKIKNIMSIPGAYKKENDLINLIMQNIEEKYANYE